MQGRAEQVVQGSWVDPSKPPKVALNPELSGGGSNSYEVHGNPTKP
jgi:hypothetical protein